MASLKYWVWLSELPGVGLQEKRRLLELLRSPEEIYYASPEQLRAVLPASALPIFEHPSLEEAEAILERCDRLQIQLMTQDDGVYPEQLRSIFDPPLLLYWKGRLPQLDQEAVIALVGTRSATPYGIDTAEKLGYGLARHGAVVVSGLARGIDTAAIRGALRGGGTVLGVLGGGIDQVYPRENRGLYEDVCQSGVLFSEYPPGTEPLSRHFPVRNRIISGLSIATVVVEAPEKSGALITARTALDQGRDVFAVPGNIDAPQSRGCHQLLREGAGLAASSWDILCGYEALFPNKLRDLSYPQPKTSLAQPQPPEPAARPLPEEPSLPVLNLRQDHAGLTDDQICILRVLSPREPMQIDDIIEQTRIPARRAMSALTMLEIENYVQQSAGKHFVRTVAIQ